MTQNRTQQKSGISSRVLMEKRAVALLSVSRTLNYLIMAAALLPAASMALAIVLWFNPAPGAMLLIAFLASLFGMWYYSQLQKSVADLVVTMIRILGEPARVRDKDGRFIPVETVAKGKKRYIVVEGE